MTPSATKTKPSAAKRERELENALAAAKAERDETTDRAHQHRTRINTLKDQLAERQITDPDEFGEAGLPKERSQSGKIAGQIAELERTDRYADAINGAQGRVDLAEDELRRFRAERTRDLLAEMEPAARAAVDRWMKWVAEGEVVRRELLELSARSTGLVVATNLYGGNSRATVPDFEHQQHALKLASEVPPLPLPGPFVAELEADQKEAEDG